MIMYCFECKSESWADESDPMCRQCGAALVPAPETSPWDDEPIDLVDIVEDEKPTLEADLVADENPVLVFEDDIVPLVPAAVAMPLKPTPVFVAGETFDPVVTPEPVEAVTVTTLQWQQFAPIPAHYGKKRSRWFHLMLALVITAGAGAAWYLHGAGAAAPTLASVRYGNGSLLVWGYADGHVEIGVSSRQGAAKWRRPAGTDCSFKAAAVPQAILQDATERCQIAKVESGHTPQQFYSLFVPAALMADGDQIKLAVTPGH